MRLQLIAGALCAGSLFFLSGSVRAEGEASMRMTLFHEPSARSSGVSVLHPQIDASGVLRETLRVSAGYSADVVSGATPAVYGPASGPDAVSGATRFSDLRHDMHAGLEYTSGAVALGLRYGYSRENDYRSHALTVTTRGDLWDRNFTVGLAYTHNFDSVCNANNRAAAGPLDLRPLTASAHCFNDNQPDVVTESLAIDTFEPTIGWTATPRLLLQGGGTVSLLDGFQANPYRSVLIGSQHRTPQERLPEGRQRYALFLRGSYAFPSIRAAAALTGRGYSDSWGVQGITGEVDFQKYLGSSFLVRVRTRYHQQGSATFYRTTDEYRTLGPAGQYWAGDRELAPLGTFLVGGRVSYLKVADADRPLLSFLDDLDVSLKFDYLKYLLDSDSAPNADRSHALIIQTAVTVSY